MDEEINTLEKIATEGFKETKQNFADLQIYKKNNEYILYDPKKNEIYMRFEAKP